MLERCKKICGESPESCIVESKEQVICIADMVLNKITGLEGFLEFALDETDIDKVREHIGNAKKLLEDLTEWVRFLQISYDLRKLDDLSEDARDRRRFKRYPLPEIYQSLINILVFRKQGPVKIKIINFSKKGILFLSPLPFERDSNIEGVVSITAGDTTTKEYSFRAKVIYCTKTDEGYKAGVELQELSKTAEVDFFRIIYNLVFQHLIHNPPEQI
jgi:hypothetical protein